MRSATKGVATGLPVCLICISHVTSLGIRLVLAISTRVNVRRCGYSDEHYSLNSTFHKIKTFHLNARRLATHASVHPFRKFRVCSLKQQ